MCKKYLNYRKISKVQIQSLLGNLIYIHKAVSPARLFVNRIIALLKVAPERGYVQVGADFKRDLSWFTAFAVLYNGFTKFNSVVKQPDFTVYVDACLSGLGGRCGYEVYTLPIAADGQNIAYWEAIHVLFALRMWAHRFSGRTILIYCDNAAATHIFNTARGSDWTLQAIARNIWLLAATHDMTLIFEHIPGNLNCTADLLARWNKVYNPIGKLYTILNDQPKWMLPDKALLALNWDI
jgi:hypothetical protein